MTGNITDTYDKRELIFHSSALLTKPLIYNADSVLRCRSLLHYKTHVGFNSTIQARTVGLWKARQVHKSSIVASHCVKVCFETKLTLQCSSRWCEVIKSMSSGRFFSVFSFRDPSKISDDWAYDLYPLAEWDLIQQVHLFQSSCQMTHRTAELSWTARALIGREHDSPAPTATRRDRPYWPSNSGNRKQFVEKQ